MADEAIEPALPAPAAAERLKPFSELLDLPQKERVKHELRILEGLMAQAIKDKEYAGALRTFSEAHAILSRAGKR